MLSAMPHIPPERLLAVACSDDTLFTAEEFSHIKDCLECFQGWRECIEKSGRRIEKRLRRMNISEDRFRLCICQARTASRLHRPDRCGSICNINLLRRSASVARYGGAEIGDGWTITAKPGG